MQTADIIRALSEAIQRGACVPILGAGTSAEYVDSAGAVHKGMPVARAMLASLQAKRTYMTSASTFGEATFLLRQNEGRVALESLFRSAYGGGLPLPAHRLLASLGLPCYVSFNFDELLERALADAGVQCLPVVEDEDVALFRGSSTLVIKPHGSVSRPKTMRIATDETLNLELERPLLTAMLTTWLAEKTAFFLGFGLGDSDFIQVMHRLKHWLGAHMPRSYAVMRGADSQMQEFWRAQGVEVCTEDLTEILAKLETECSKQRLQVTEDLEPWMRHAFFRELLKIRGLPTETQVIEELLAEIRRRIEAGRSPREIQGDCVEAVDLVLEHRRNFSALRQVRMRLGTIFDSEGGSGKNQWERLLAYEQERQGIRDRLAERGGELLGDARRILIYSQSQRVVDCLKAVSPEIQRLTVLSIAECRPKSPRQFLDAIATARLLQATHYTFRLAPDVVCCHLLEKGAVDLVLMGAHTVFRQGASGPYRYFVNTCGSGVIARLAAEKGVPLRIVFESEKVVDLDSAESQVAGVSFDEEENIGQEVTSALSLDGSLAERTRVINVGYDLVRWLPNVQALTDRVS